MKLRGLLKNRQDLEERDWLLNWLLNGEVGLSSQSLATWAVTGEPRPGRPWRNGRWCEPADKDDLRRCELMFESAPPRVQQRMKRKLDEWRAKIEAQGW